MTNKLTTFKCEALYNSDWIYEGDIYVHNEDVSKCVGSFSVKFRGKVEIGIYMTKAEIDDCIGEFLLLYERDLESSERRAEPEFAVKTEGA